MKKILLALVLVIVSLMPVVATATSASASVCESHYMYGEWKYQALTDTTNYVLLRATIEFDHCYGNGNQWDKLTDVKYRFERSDPCGVYYGAGLQGANINVGAFKGWNPGDRDFACSDGQLQIKYAYPPADAPVIWHDDADRCAYVYFTVKKNNMPDVSHTSNIKCLD